MEKVISKVKLSEVLAPIISSRDLIENLARVILKTDSKAVELDFRNIEFISRSAAHAMLLLKEDLQRRLINKKEIIFINTNEEVRNMLRAVAANRAIPHMATAYEAKHVSIDALLEGI